MLIMTIEQKHLNNTSTNNQISDHHRVCITEYSRLLTVISFLKIYDLMLVTLPICSFIRSSSSASWSCNGWINSSVIFRCSSKAIVQDIASLRQCSYSFDMESTSSVT